MQNNQVIVPYNNRRPYSSHIPILNPNETEEFDKILNTYEIDGHIYLLSSSGWGKTNFLKLTMVRFVLEAKGSIILFDPHGDIARQFAQLMDNKRDIVYIDLFLDNKKTPVINPVRLKNINEETVSIMAQELVNAFESIMGSEFSLNMEVLLTMCLYALLRKGDSSIEELQRFFDDDNNEDLIEFALKSPNVYHREFFKSQFSNGKFKKTKEALSTRLQLLLQHPHLYNFLIGESTIDLEKLLNKKGSIVIFRFPQGKMKKTLQPIGKFLMAMIQGIIQNRSNIPKESRIKTLLVLDEFQNFISTSVNEMLSESRKNNLTILCAHQHLSQLDKNTKDSIMSNMRTKVVGACSAKDLKEISNEIGVDEQSLQQLSTGEFFVTNGANSAIKTKTSDLYLEDRGAIPYGQWKYHLKYQKKKYYTTINKESDVEIKSDVAVESSKVDVSLPIPDFDIGE